MLMNLEHSEVELIRDSLLSERARQYDKLRGFNKDNNRGYPYNRHTEQNKAESENKINKIQIVLDKLTRYQR